jgi:hypothetical protein
MVLPFILEHGRYGPRIALTGPWSPSIAEYMRYEGVRELYLNHARGWNGTSLEFLTDLPQLTAFSILDFTITDVSPVHSLPNLRSLEISTYCKTPINFHRFAELEHIVFYWRHGGESLFDSRGLRSVFLHRYGELTSKPFGQLLFLEELSIANSELEEIRSLGHLQGLRFLGLYNLKNLTSLQGVEKLSNLEALEVSGCKRIRGIDEVSALSGLRRLQLSDAGPVKSLGPLRSLVHLEEVLFYESTNVVDGDLTPLMALPRLSKVSFQNRRHYSHRREEFSGSSRPKDV